MNAWCRRAALLLTALTALSGRAFAGDKEDAANAASIAQDKATAALAMQQAQAELTKAQLANQASLQTYYQSLIPDPAKYKIPAPSAPKLQASASRMAFDEVNTVATTISTKIASKLNCTADGRATILAGESGARSMLAMSMSTISVLTFARKKLESKRLALEKEITETEMHAASPVAFAAVSDIVQLGAAFAMMLKPQRAFDTINEQPLADSVFQAKVISNLAASECIAVIEPASIISLEATPSPNAIPANAPEELAAAARLTGEVAASREAVKAANVRIQALTKLAAGEKNKDTKKKWEGLGKSLTESATVITGLADESEKGLSAMYTVDAQGNTPMDTAVRGGLLRKTLSNGRLYLISLKTISSDSDIVAKDCLFCRYKVGIGSTTIVSWRLIDNQGKVNASGAEKQSTNLARVALPE